MVVIRRAGLDLPQNWLSNESTLNKQKIVSEEIHPLEEDKHFATALGQCQQGAWTKWESAKENCHMEQHQTNRAQEIKFPHKGSL